MKKEIRIVGFGGQGIILAGVILGEAAARAGHHAVQTQSYGPESRGGAARSEVVISSDVIDYPRVSRADVVVALSQEGYDKFGKGLGDGALLVVDSDLVKAEDARTVPFTKTAEEVGHKMPTNEAARPRHEDQLFSVKHSAPSYYPRPQSVKKRHGPHDSCDFENLKSPASCKSKTVARS